ncbi:MAG: hypothetical protein M1829_002088 [Trizodia sp. TS-e1964]|nr:MAG: hypothetical protein M1829_002088 [Trizodia sp. TS-e1964]
MNYNSSYTAPSTAIEGRNTQSNYTDASDTAPYDRRTETALRDQPNSDLHAAGTRRNAGAGVGQNALPGIEHTDEPDIKHHHRQTATDGPAALANETEAPTFHHNNNAENGTSNVAADRNLPSTSSANTTTAADEPATGPPQYTNETVISVPVPASSAGNLREHYPLSKVAAKLVGKDKSSPDFHIERMKRGEYLEKLDDGVLGRGKGRDQIVGLVAPEKAAEAAAGGEVI